MKKILRLLSALILMAVLGACVQPGRFKPKEKAFAFDGTAIQKDLDYAASLCGDILGSFSSGRESGLTEQEGAQMLTILGQLKAPVYYYYGGMDMVNHEKAALFWEAVQAGQDAQIVIYCITRRSLRADALACQDGEIYRQLFYYDYQGKEGITHDALERVENLRMTPKGYLLFEIPEYEGYSRQYEGYRVQPLGEGLRALNQKYVQGLSYSLDGILSCDWSADDFSALNLEQVYEFLYVRFHGSYPSEDYAKTYEEAAKTQAQGFICIPADEVEAFMLQHLPLTREQLRRSFPFDKEADAYIHTPYQGGSYSPVPELVCAEEKADGSIVLTVDAVSADFGDDRSTSSLLTVKDNPDGSIRYLSNRVTVPFKS